MAPAADPNAKTIDDLRKWLRPTEYLSPGNEYMKHLNSYALGTGDWLRDSETFRKWEDGAESGCLWVRGVPGSGKSVFAASTVKTLAETQDGEGRTSPVLFFFFRQIVEKNHDPKYLIRDWVAQLLPFSSDLQREVDELSNEESVDGIENTKLWDVLVRAMKGIKKIYCVADALDEMDDQHASFIDKLKQLGAQKPDSIKVMLTSRPIHRIENQLRHPTVESVKLEPAQIYPDIVSYVSTRLESVEPRLSEEKEIQVKEAICERSEGLFLYARLTMDTLTAGLQEGSIIEDTLPTSLAQLPRNLTELYTKMLAEHSRRSNVSQEHQFAIVQCITLSSRPMRLIELGSIISLLTKDAGVGLNEGKEVVRQACGRFLELLEDESVSVIHHSFTEFVRDKTRSTEAGAFPVLSETEAQRMMLEVVLQYLDSCQLPNSVQISVEIQVHLEEQKLDDNMSMKDEDDENDFYDCEIDSLDNRSGLIRATERKSHEIQNLTFLYPFMGYATKNLIYHIRNSEAGKDLSILDLYFVPGKSAFEIWLMSEWYPDRRRNAQPLHVAAYYGLTRYVQHLIDTGSGIDARDGEGRTPLIYAVEQGHVEVASILLSHGANADADDRIGLKPLHIAVENDQPEIVRLLLAAGVSPKTKKTKSTPELILEQLGSDIGDTPMQYACQSGNVEILTQFLDYLDEGDLCRCLHWAVLSVKPHAVETILNTGKVPIDVLIDGVSALVTSAYFMSPAVIEVLLRHGANPNLRINKEHWSCYPLPDSEIKLKGESEEGPTAMHAIVGYQGNVNPRGDKQRAVACLKLLIDAGGDVRTGAQGNRTPLHYAVRTDSNMFGKYGPEFGDDARPALLLAHGADPNARCNLGTTPLHNVSPDRPTVVELLIRNGAEVNARDNGQSTPLLSILANMASDRMPKLENTTKGRYKTIYTLLEHGADVTVENEKGLTALHYMFAGISQFQNELLWKAFIKAGANLNKPNRKGDPPLLSMKVAHNKLEDDKLLRMLVKEGLQLNPISSTDNVILFGLFDSYGVKWGSFEKLFNLGFSVNARNENGATLLHRCLQKGAPFEIFESLVKAGADPIAVDSDRNTLFHETALNHPGLDFAIKMKALVDMGIGTDTQNKTNLTPLHIACATRIRRDHRGERERAEEFLDWLLNGKLCPPSNVNTLDNLGASPIHYAASFSEFHVGRLLKAGADPSLKTNEGLTPLHIAARGRQSTVICLLLSEYQKRGILSLIIDIGDDSGRTALHYACRSGRPESVSYLLSAGASFSIQDKHGRTPLHALGELQEENLFWIFKQSGDLPERFDAACLTLGDLGRPCSSENLKTRYSDSVRSKDIIEMLEKAGANLEATMLINGDVCTLMDLALETQFAELVNELHRRGLSAHDKIGEALMSKSVVTEKAEALLAKIYPPRSESYPEHDEGQLSTKDLLRKFEEILREGDCNLFNEFVKLGGDLRARGRWSYMTGLHKLVEWGHAGLLEKYSEDAARIDSEEWMQEKENPGSLLCTACEQPLPRLDVIKVLVEKINVDVNFISNRINSTHKGSKATALHLLSAGAHFWNMEAIEYLLDHGANLEARNEYGETPLMTAVSSASPNGFWKEQTMRILLKRGANPNILCNDGDSCLNVADHINVTRMLLDHGADVNVGVPPPLTSAVATMNVDAARLLLEAGADPDKGHPLHEAARPFDGNKIEDPLRGRQQREMILLLLKHGANPFAFLEDGSSVLQKVIEEHGITELFLELPNFPIELRGKGGRTPLISACFPTITPAPRVWSDPNSKSRPVCDPATAFSLLKMQANVRSTDNLGRTALHWICTLPEELDETHLAVFQVLVDRSSHAIHQKDQEGFTPLQLAIANSHMHPAIIRYLISCGCDPNEPDPTGSTVLHYLAPLLLGEKAKAAKAAEHFKAFLARGIPIDHRNNSGETALLRFISTSWEGTKDSPGTKNHPIYAIENDISHVKAIHIFLEAGADIQTRNNQEETLLHITAQRWRERKKILEEDQKQDMLEIFKDLMARGLDPRTEDTKYRTAIDVAVTSGNLFLVDLFGPKRRDMMKEIAIEHTDDEEEGEDEEMID